MLSLIIGTTNEAKIKQIMGALAPLRIPIQGIADKNKLPEIRENGTTAQENARKKAIAYAKAFGQTVLSMDNALYFEGLSTEQQPGIAVRRIPGSSGRPSDEQLLNYYSDLIKKLGARVHGHWEFAICVADPKGHARETSIISPRIFTSLPSPKFIPGYPLESLQIDPESNRYISEMSQQEQDLFWQRTTGKELCEFVKSIDL